MNNIDREDERENRVNEDDRLNQKVIYPEEKVLQIINWVHEM